ncbi:MAG TPA: AAA domain-containing protein [Pyrinomonadaceae bacterium]|nr:AAA domain-containing protein [Pyrinomonadaceae bacterium]
MAAHLVNMIEALRLEIAKIKKRGSSTQIELRGGEKIGTAENKVLYRFSLQEDVKNLRDDIPVRVICDRVEVDGNIVSVAKGSVIVALEIDLGPKIALVRLITDDSFLVEMLREKLEEVEKGTAHFNHQLAASVIGVALPECGIKEPAPQVFSDCALNEIQMNAVRLAFGSNTCFIWGPPGTGKTTTLAHVVESHYRAGHSVLIVSNTNVAVDTALQRIAQRLETEPEFHEGAVLRHGPLGKELEERYGERVNVDKIVERLSKDLDAQKQALQNELATKHLEAEPFKEALERFEELKRLNSEIQQREHASRSKQSHRQELQDKLRTGRIELNKLEVNLERAREFGSLRRFLTRLNPERLEAEIHALTRANKNVESALAATSRQLDEQSVELERLHRDLIATKAAVTGYSEAQAKSQLTTIETSIAQIKTKLRAIEDQLAALRQQVLNNCRILATTVYRTYLKGQVTRVFDVVIVDEASMLMLPMTFFAAGLASKAVVVAGDFRQLAPIVASDDPLVSEWLKKDAFEKTNIPREVKGHAAPKHLAVLSVQYRMHRDICDCVNALFYSDRPLETPKGIGSDAKYFPLGDSRLLFVNTTELNPWSAFKLGGYSRYNLLHALLVRNLTVSLDEELIGPAGACKLGIISPFSAQTSLMQALLNDSLTERGSELAATAHRFQGNERDSIIIDLTDSVSTRLSRFMKARDANEDGARLLNVAISRARHRIILVAHFDFLRDNAPQDGKLQRLLDYFEEHGEPINATDVLNLRQEDWAEGIFHVSPSPEVDLSNADAQFLTEGTFYPRFTEDLKNARSSILIFSPFLTKRGTNRWMDLLRFAISRGVRVRLVTRPPGDQGGVLDDGLPDTVKHIRELGIPVDYRARIHEKIAIIDDEILWHGSLNILSQRDTTESMLRLRSPAACARLGGYVTSPTARKQQKNICEPENPECPDCGEPMTWKNGRYGIYFECDDCGTKIDPNRSRRTARRSPVGRRAYSTSSSDSSKPCPRVGCGGQLIRKNGRRGPFLGCTNYRIRNCRESQSL